MPGLQIITTKAGRAALVNAEHNGTAPLKIAEIGITAAVFSANEETLALPGEIKRIKTMSGEVVAPDTMHVTIRDESSDTYTVRGIGYWLSNGVLLGVYSQPDPILQKSTQSMMLLAADTVFTTIAATSLTFGDANFTNPPATTLRQGVVELATSDETVAGKDATRAVTPAGLAPALVKAIDSHKAEADPHQAYLTADRADSRYFRKLPAVFNSDTDCDTLLETGVRDVSVANDRGIIAATKLPTIATGYGTLITENGGQFVQQIYTEVTIVHRTWIRNGYLGAPQPFKGSDWKLLWDSATFDPGAKQDKLGFAPVQQGTGVGQSPNTVKIGWAGDQLKATVDALDLGNFVFRTGLDATLKSYLPLTGGSVSGQLQVSGSIGAIGSEGAGRPTIEVMGKDKADHAYMTFHRPGVFATHFGLDANNDLAVGGYSMGATAYKLWHAGNFNPGDRVSGSSSIRLNWSGVGGQPTWLFGGNSPDNVTLYNPSNFNVSYANSANYASSAGNANTWQGFPLRYAENPPGNQPYYILGIEASHSEFSIYNRTALSVGSAMNAIYAGQLTGPGLQNQSIGGYLLNKNHTNPEAAGSWQLRGFAYDFASGGDGGIGTRTALWQRVA